MAQPSEQDGIAVSLWDDIGKRYTTPQELGVLRKEWISERLRLHAAGAWLLPVDLDQIAEQQFATLVLPLRKQRGDHLRKDVGYLLDGFQEDGAYVDPLLSQVQKVGDGTDLILRFWGVKEWRTWAYIALQKAAEISAAAYDKSLKSERMIAWLEQKQATYTGDLFE